MWMDIVSKYCCVYNGLRGGGSNGDLIGEGDGITGVQPAIPSNSFIIHVVARAAGQAVGPVYNACGERITQENLCACASQPQRIGDCVAHLGGRVACRFGEPGPSGAPLYGQSRSSRGVPVVGLGGCKILAAVKVGRLAY